MHSDKVSDYQAGDATQYESQAAAIGWNGHEIMFGLMYEFLKPDDTLLDIGIGTGLSSLLFHKTGLRVSGFENSAEMLHVCRSKDFSGKIVQHDLRNLPFPYEMPGQESMDTQGNSLYTAMKRHCLFTSSVSRASGASPTAARYVSGGNHPDFPRIKTITSFRFPFEWYSPSGAFYGAGGVANP